MEDAIKLIIWGTKGGHKVLCSNFIEKEYNSVEIKNTYKDIRTYLEIKKTGSKYWGVEFTKQYKVFTMYTGFSEPNGAGRPGSYIAINIYIKHNYDIDGGVHHLLTQIMQKYEEVYINTNTMSMLSKPENIRDFNKIIENTSVKPTLVRNRRPISAQIDKLGYYFYDSETEIKAFFENPYRPAFYEYQETIFINKDYNNSQRPYFTITNKIDIIDKTKVNELERGHTLTISNEIKSLYVNNVLIDLASKSYFEGLFDEDRLEITFRKIHHEDYTYSTSIAQLKRAGVIRESNVNFTIPSKQEWFKPKTFLAKINAPNCRGVIFILKSDIKNLEYKSSTGGLIQINETDRNSLFDVFVENQIAPIKKSVKIPNSDETVDLSQLVKLQINVQNFNGESPEIKLGEDLYKIPPGGRTIYYLGTVNEQNLKINNRDFDIAKSSNGYTISPSRSKNFPKRKSVKKAKAKKVQIKVRNNEDTDKTFEDGIAKERNLQETNLEQDPQKRKRIIILALLGSMVIGLGLGLLIGKFLFSQGNEDKKVRKANETLIDYQRKQIEKFKDQIDSKDNIIKELNKSLSQSKNKNHKKQGTKGKDQNQENKTDQTTTEDARRNEVYLKNNYSQDQLAEMYWQWKIGDSYTKIEIQRAIARKLNSKLRDNKGIGEASIKKATTFLNFKKKTYTQ